MNDNHLSLPGLDTLPTTLGQTEEAFWDILKGGNRVNSGQLIKPAGIIPPDLINTTKINSITPKLRSPLTTHPTILVCKFNCNILFILSFTGYWFWLLGAKMRVHGPITPGSPYGHPCYASRLFWGIFSRPDDGIDEPHCFEGECPIVTLQSLLASGPSTAPTTPSAPAATLPSTFSHTIAPAQSSMAPALLPIINTLPASVSSFPASQLSNEYNFHVRTSLILCLILN